jgi:class 3 adenylate cyclase
MFVDLAGFTPLTITLGDHRVAEILRQFAGLIRTQTGVHGGRIIKQIGDAFMLAFDRPGDSLRFGAELMGGTSVDPEFPALHIGAHWGTVLYLEGDYFGSGVNLAARVTSSAEAGQFLITDTLAEAAAEAGATVPAVRLPPRHLKGVSEPLVVLEVQPAAGTRG